MKANEIVATLDILKDSSYQKIMIDGTWGIGKTKYVMDFLLSYHHGCYVSLFGKRDVDSILQEIYFKVIETDQKGKQKAFFNKMRASLNHVDVSMAGVSLSIPLIGSIYNSIIKELGSKKSYIIVFDDFERKHESFDIKEIFGVIDNLSKIDGIKILLITASDQLGEEKEDFNKYLEKAIDKTIRIDSFADDAPMNILGKHEWDTICKLVDVNKFKNLRIFKKTSLFIKEVVHTLGEDIFSEKFIKEDLVKMCFASVFFNIIHNDDFKSLHPNDDWASDLNNGNDNEIIESLNASILKNSLSNDMCKVIFIHIRNWFIKGFYCKESIVKLIDSIKNTESQPINFYTSQDDIIELIDKTKQRVKALTGTESLIDVITELVTAIRWCNVFSIEFGITNEEIIKSMNNNIINYMDLEKELYHNLVDEFTINIDSGVDIVERINKEIEREYSSNLINKIEKDFVNQAYNQYNYIKNLADSLFLTRENSLVKTNVLERLDNYNYFFPMPTGNINEDSWYWCHQINNLIPAIERHWNIENYYESFKKYLSDFANESQDRMLIHRLTQLTK